jgi:hypothetical protein
MKKTFLYIMTAALLAASCNNAMIEDPVQYGTLSVSLAGEPGIEVVTRAEENETVDVDTFKVYALSAAQNQKLGTYGSLRDPQELIRLQAGDYTIYAENCDASEAESGNGCKRMYGEDDVTIAPGVESKAEITCAVVNAKVSVVFNENIEGKFKENALTVTFSRPEDSNLKLSARQCDATYLAGRGIFWFNAGSVVTYTISGTPVGSNDVLSVSGSIKLNADKQPVALSAKDNFEINVSVKQSTDGSLSLSASVDTTVEKGEDINAGFNPYK